MLRLFARLMLVAGIGMAGAACVNDGYGQPTGYNNPYYNGGYAQSPYYNSGYAQPRYGYAQPAPYYGGYPYQQQGSWYNQGDGRRYTSVTVTNRGQNGYRDDVV
ncbi:MAG: hypothetical protein JO339_40685 [Alphaproteobacteria bacterium]|nr:hypothetical protein [Alphaproteobacteria bacterium]